jgi:NADPH-dependent curcumin reductase CurA
MTISGRVNRQIVLGSLVHGAPTPGHFAQVASAVPEPAAGEMLVRNLYFSLEPAIRGWLEGKANYLPPVPIGSAVRGPTLGRIVQSKLAGYKEGELVFGLNHWEDYSILRPDTVLLEKVQPEAGVPLSYNLGALGGSGQTAYVGLHEVGLIWPGQTVAISAAAGAVGSLAGQIARLRGCRVIGIVGSAAKARLLQERLGFHATVNYRETTDLAAAVSAVAPDGLDVYFDNVGGPILNALLPVLKPRGRVVACGMISEYNRSDDPYPITNLWQVVARQLTIQGFLLFAFEPSRLRARAQLAEWVRAGELVVLEHITRGFANTPAAFCELMTGRTTGKALVELDAEESAT